MPSLPTSIFMSSVVGRIPRKPLPHHECENTEDLWKQRNHGVPYWPFVLHCRSLVRGTRTRVDVKSKVWDCLTWSLALGEVVRLGNWLNVPCWRV